MTRFIEERIVGKAIKCLKDAGTPIVRVWDGEENHTVATRTATIEAVFAVDEAWIFTADDSWIRLTLGEGTDVICDYTTDLEEILEPVHALVDHFDRR